MRLKTKHYKKISYILVLLTLLMAFNACSPLSLVKEDDDSIAVLPGDTTQIQPQEYTLYYKMANEAYIVPEIKTLTIPESKSIELVLLQELVKGPDNTSQILQNHINKNTRIVSVSDNKEVLFVTVSNNFLKPPDSIPDYWQNDEQLVNQVMEFRQLAVNSIINTITELGIYSYVQIYIDYDGNGTGQRPTRRELGFTGEDIEQFVEPLSRKTDFIFTPNASISMLMDAVSVKDWNEVSGLISYKMVEDDELVKLLELQDISLIEYEIGDTTVSNNGKYSVVLLSFTATDSDSAEYEKTNLSIQLYNEDGIWKCTYASLNQILNDMNG